MLCTEALLCVPVTNPPSDRMNVLYTALSCALLVSLSVHAQDCTTGRYTEPLFEEVIVTSAVPFGSNTSVSGGSQTLRMDVYEPAGDLLAQRPVVIIAFGGSFVAGARADVAELCTEFARRGYVAVAPDYRVGFFLPNALTTTLAVMRGAHDMKACIRFLRKSVEEGDPYGIDPDRIIAGGVSAGAISAIHATYLDSDEEMPAVLADQIVQLGGVEGNSGSPGFSSAVAGCLSFSGAIGDTTWVNAGNVPLYSIHETGDDVVPYFTEEVAVFGIATGLIASGSHDLHLRMQNLGIENCLLSYTQNDHVGYFTYDPVNSLAFALGRCASLVCGLDGNCGNIVAAVPVVNTTSSFTVTPNPVVDEVVVHVEGRNDLFLMDAKGELVWSSLSATGAVRVDMTSFPAGVYFMRVIGASAGTTRIAKL